MLRFRDRIYAMRFSRHYQIHNKFMRTKHIKWTLEEKNEAMHFAPMHFHMHAFSISIDRCS